MSIPLEPSERQMREMGQAALSFVIDHVQALPDSPAVDLDAFEEHLSRFLEPPPEAGGDLEPRLDDLALAASKSFNTAGQGYLAYIPGGGLYSAALADLLALGVNRYVTLWEASPLMVAIEQSVVRWLCDLFGYPEGARGFLSSGGSMANFSAVVTARKALLPEDFLEGTIYATDQVHASVMKAAALAGFPTRAVRVVATGRDRRMDVAELEAMVKRDRLGGSAPFLVVGSAGTTNTGTVDPLDDIADVATRENMWFHVDGAYGGFFQLTERGRERFAGIERASSITLDPHKGMFLPYGTGCLLVRDGEALRSAHQARADYLQDLAAEGRLPNFSEYSPELSREFRGLRVWLPLQLHGVGAFREALDEKLDLARRFYEALKATDGFELASEPDLSIVAFRYLPRVGNAEAFNRRLLERIHDSGRVFLSSTMLDGVFTIRVAVLSFRTHEERVDEAIQIIRSAAAELDA